KNPCKQILVGVRVLVHRSSVCSGNLTSGVVAVLSWRAMAVVGQGGVGSRCGRRRSRRRAPACRGSHTVIGVNEAPLSGGRVTQGVVSVGDTVRRPRPPNAPLVRA